MKPGIYRLWAMFYCAIGAGAIALPAHAQAQPMQLYRGDRLLFVGDEVTQQMFYTRATATALLRLHAGKDLRFFNGGRDGDTAGDAVQWIDELMGLVQPTVVFVCFGFNEAQAQTDPGEAVRDYLKSLGDLLERIRRNTTVREVVVIGPPPVQKGLRRQLLRGETNHTLMVLTQIARQAASQRGARFVELFSHMSAVYLAQSEIGGEQLSIGGRLPNEQAHMVIASLVLRGLGVTGRQLQAVGWSPLLPAKMRRVRQVLAIPVPAPDAPAAASSHALYVALARFDELFFRIWRLPRRRSSRLASEAEVAWQAVAQLSASGGGVVR